MGNIPPSILRQPPTPSGPLTAASNEKGKIEPEMVDSTHTYYLRSCKRKSIHTYYLRSCKRKRLTGIESLPDELLFEVLVRLPAQDIYDSARLVCSKWYHMIHTHTFIHAHLEHSTFGLLFQSRVGEDSFFMSVGKRGKIEIYKFNYKLRCPVSTSCNGLLLEFQDRNYDNLYISNPATRQIFVLPPNYGNVINLELGLYGIGYAAASKVYKAVIPFPSSTRRKATCYILTIGVDKSWRTFGIEHVSLDATEAFLRSPLIAEGFMLWKYAPRNVVLILNLETEVITETRGPIPRLVCGKKRRNFYLSTGRYFSLLIPCGEFCWEVWEMKPKIDYQWRKVSDISLEAAHKCGTFEQLGFKHFEFVIPIDWVKYLEVLVFGVSGGLLPFIFVFNLISQEISTIELPTIHQKYSRVLHKNSLMWLGGC